MLQIEDVTSRLPGSLRSVLEARGEILEALCVNAHLDRMMFTRAAAEVEHGSGVERIDVRADAKSSWLNQSQTLKDVLTSSEPVDASDLNTTLGLSEGGTVWLSRRPKRPEVSTYALDHVSRTGGHSLHARLLGWVDTTRSPSHCALGRRAAQRRPCAQRRAEISLGDGVPALHARGRGQGVPRPWAMEQLAPSVHCPDVGGHREDVCGQDRGGMDVRSLYTCKWVYRLSKGGRFADSTMTSC